MKSQLDERQIQDAARVAGISFYIMYMVCAISIVFQLTAAGHLNNVIGETITLLAGGSVYLIGSIKKGLGTGKSRSPVHMLLESAGFSIIFTVFYTLAIRKKAGPEAEQMTAFLKKNDIYATVQTGIQELYTGDSVSGEKIMVSSQDRQKAQRLLQDFTPVETRASDLRKQTTKVQKAVNWILLGIIAAILIFAVIILL